MCGFAAIIALEGQLAQDAMQRLKVSTMQLAHRGPDDEAFYRSAQFSAGFRRLKIIDLSNDARQPMSDETGRYWIIFNGEIYNYKELREELAKVGFSFRTKSDTEVLLKAFMHWGDECLARLNGMFAFLIWDKIEQSLFGARDRFGEKPLYWVQQGDTICFASEIKGLFPLLGEVPEANALIIRNYLQSGQADAVQETFYKGIRSIPAAHKLVIRRGRMAVQSYWKLVAAEVACDEPISRIRELFIDSVKLRLRSDVPVGTCLSGGIDSGAIVCTMSRILQDSAIQANRKTFTAAYPEFDEADLVREINHQTGSIGHSITPAPTSIHDLSNLLRFHDEPFHSFSAFASFQVMKLAKDNGVTVVLNGQGADEMLAGYPKYINSYIRDLLFQGSCFAAWRAAKESSRLTGMSGAISMLRTLRKSAMTIGRESSWLNGLRNLSRKRKATEGLGLTPEFADVTNELGLTQANSFTGKGGALKRQLHYSLTVAHLPLYLRVEDRNSMANSLESRLPFLDHRLAEFVFSLPISLFMQGGTNKYLFREAMAGILPDSVRQKKEKFGFPTPDVGWLYGKFREEIIELLESPEFSSRGIFDVEYLKKRYLNETASWQNTSHAVLWRKRSFWFQIISLELWSRIRNDYICHQSNDARFTADSLHLVNEAN
jgi:asparagine synthase (glutamine-hydrolysing)